MRCVTVLKLLQGSHTSLSVSPKVHPISCPINRECAARQRQLPESQPRLTYRLGGVDWM
jgi:hypothetical protein